MRLQSIRQHLYISLLPALLCLSSPAFSGQAGNVVDLRISPSSHPAAETIFVPPLDELPTIIPDASWYEQPGAGKGLSGKVELDEERFVAADIAVLDRGFSSSWPVLISEHRQPAVLVGPSGIAGLKRTKQLLIIPSGALSNTAESVFFKAGLAEFARAGGIIFCLTQRKGIDFSALPVPVAQRLEAAGWTEESGPLFRASTIQIRHPLFANIAVPSPAMETDGYFTVYPRNARVLLSRTDGFPTVIAYPYEKGWVIATTLFTDFSQLLGPVEPDEKTFVHNLLAWAQNPLDSSDPAASDSMQPEPAAESAKNGQPKPPSRLHIRTRAERKDNLAELFLEIPAQPQLAGRAVLLRSGGSERTFTLANDMLPVSLEVPVAPDQSRISYALYETDGRAIARGSVAVPAAQPRIATERPYYFPGDTAVINVNGIGKGEIMAGGFGFLDNEIISDPGSMNLTLPHQLPAGIYRIHWSYREIRGNETQGDLYVDVAGYLVDVRNMALERKPGQTGAAIASFDIHADKAVSGKLKLMLKSPDGSVSVAAEPVLSLTEGVQSIPVSFPFSADRGGIWELMYSFHTTLPAGPIDLASGSMLFDAGHSAVLAVATDNPLYYEPAGPVAVTAILAGRENTAVEVLLDGKQVVRETIDIAGIAHYRAALPQPGPGFHTVRVSISPNSSAEHSFTYGLNLPDLAATIRAGEPRADADGPAMPFTILVRNAGKDRAGQSSVTFSEDYPPGTAAMRVEVPALGPNEQHEIAVSWPLSGKAGTRTLTAAVDTENAVFESDKRNNKSSATIIVPEIMLFPGSVNPSFKAGDPISIAINGFNLTTRSQTGLVLDTQVTDPRGKALFSGSSPVTEIAPGAGKLISARVKLNSSSIGKFLVSARLSKEKRQLASVSTSFVIDPTLLLTGSFDGLPAAAVLCRPFTVRGKIMNAGNITPSSGTIVFEIAASGDGKPLYSKTVPFSPGPKNFVIDCLDLPSGAHTLRMTASVKNDRHAVSREFVIAEQQIEFKGPVDVVKINASFPRVLVRLGRESRLVEQAVAESIVKQAFEQENLHYKVVDTEDDFIAQAMTGIFNTYVFFEPHELPDTDWLEKRIERGHGLAIIGSGDTARALAEKFGFTLQDVFQKRPPSVVTFADSAEIGLSGSMPISGKAFSPRKRDAKPVASYSASGEPAALLDLTRKGKIFVLPLSLSRSAYHGGTLALYSLALKRFALSVSPETDEPGETTAMGFQVSSVKGPVKTMITSTFASGDRVLWTNAGGVVMENFVSHTVTANEEPRTILYLYKPLIQSKGSAEVFYECNGKFQSQGKIE